MKLQVGVKALIMRNDNTYLFLRRTQDFKSGPQDWDIPGGRIEVEEALEAALSREISEETGLSLTKLDGLLSAQDIFVQSKNIHVVRLTYRAQADGAVTISNEHSDYAWLTKQQLLAEEHVDSYLRQVLEVLA